MLDDRGHKVNEPLLLGSLQCRLHLQLFCTRSAEVSDYLLFYLDFETSGLDILEHHIVEIGVLCENLACLQTGSAHRSSQMESKSTAYQTRS